MKKNIVIIHYNTPHLTECLVRSINLFVKDAIIYIFDNSDKEPFTAKFDNVTIMDNTEGQIINFEEWLKHYPNKTKTSAGRNGYGSAKHAYSVQKCIEIINEGFILLDSDILLKKDISDIIDDKYVFIGGTEYWKARTGTAKSAKERAIPYLCYINVKKCKEKGIKYFDDKRIYGLTQNGDNYDTGASFLEDIKKHKLLWKRIILPNLMVHYKAGSWVEDAKTHDNYKPISFDAWLDRNKKLWCKQEPFKGKKVVYTCITGGYDELKNPRYVTNGFDYICFTDNLDMKSDVWQIMPLPNECKDLSQVKKQRYVKINPHKVLSDYDISIWVDGCVSLNDNLDELLSNVISNEISIYVPKHPMRNCIYREAKAVLSMGRDKKEIVNPQIDRYKEEGFPSEYGLLQSNILIRKHNEEDCIRLMEAWFNELKDNSHRDQLSFNYVLWKNNDIKIKYLDKNIYKSKWFNWNGLHKKGSKTLRRNLTTTNFELKKRIAANRERFNQLIKDKRLSTSNIGIY
jgi:hypothetical protein